MRFLLIVMIFLLSFGAFSEEQKRIVSPDGDALIAMDMAEHNGKSILVFGSCMFRDGDSVSVMDTVYIDGKEYLYASSETCSGWVYADYVKSGVQGSDVFGAMMFFLFIAYSLVLMGICIYKNKSVAFSVVVGLLTTVIVFFMLVFGNEMLGIVVGLTVLFVCLFVPASQDPDKMKKCPECAEAVLKDAKVCKHCGNRFD